MKEYELAKNGSSWAKWDIHVHTPGTKLSDAYTTTDETDVWEHYIDTLYKSDVKVFGITDYFSIDNYGKTLKLFKTKYPDSDKVFFPNLEFRLDVSVNKSAEEVNIHIVFDNEMTITEIRRFLSHLPTNIALNGTNISCDQLINSQQINTASVKFDDILKTLKDVFGKRLCYIIGAAANNQGLRPDNNSARKMNVSDNIERECDFLFGGAQNKDHYLELNRYTNGERAEQKPVLSCSDAHSFADLKEKLGQGAFCTWVKATPTFNGLRQIIFEPTDRVAIQITEPDYKEPHNIIKSIRIQDETNTFGNREIFLNKNLNTIIGGKSSGKSLLLYALAECIDSEQLTRLKEKFIEFKGYSLNDIAFNIKWDDGIEDTNSSDLDWDMENPVSQHKITYIPQLYINYLAEKKGESELNQLIDEILLQNHDFKVFKEKTNNQINKINSDLTIALDSLLELRKEWFESSQERKEYSMPDIYDKEIIELSDRYSILNKNSSFTEDEINEYKRLVSEQSDCDSKINAISNDKLYLQQIRQEVLQSGVNLMGSKESNIIGSINKYISRISANTTDTSKICGIIREGFKSILNKLDAEYSISEKDNAILQFQEKKAAADAKLLKYNDKLSKKSELPDLVKKIEKIKQNKTYAVELDLRKEKYAIDYRAMKNNIVALLGRRNECYLSIESTINSTMNILGSGINLVCKVVYPLNYFELYNQINRQHGFVKQLQDLFDEDSNCIHFVKLPDLFSNLMKIENGSLHFIDKSIQQLKTKTDLASTHRAILEDNFSVAYDVTYKGDNLIKMSPGKKGTVLLILFLELSSSENPILIDQPEDNLDNRTIYDLLCKMIKSKKKDRQIIVVTHNANLVVNTDAENVIVANQEGQDPDSESIEGRTKFEYINGPIELSFKNERSKEILARIGIKQHVCDILEGGAEAFKLRELKYQDELNV